MCLSMDIAMSLGALALHLMCMSTWAKHCLMPSFMGALYHVDAYIAMYFLCVALHGY